MNKVDGYLKQFVIQFSGLKLGLHEYEFELGDLFFERFKIEDINNGKVHAKFSLLKRENGLELEFEFSGTLNGACDRCLESLEFPIEGENSIQVKFGDKHSEENDELFVIAPEEYQIDIAPLLYEFISLQVPLRKVHEENDCNAEVIARLHNTFEVDEEEESDVPSVWDKLKKLK